MSAWLEQTAKRHAARPALIDAGGSLDFGQLAERVARCAGDLAAAGIRTGDRVLLPAPIAAPTAIRLHALLWLGAAAIPVDPSTPRSDLQLLCDRLRPHALIGNGDERPIDRPDPPFIDAGALDRGRAEPIPPAPFEPDRVATIVLTSGSRARPKAVPLTLANHAASVRAVAERCGVGAADRWLLCLPLEHVGGLSILVRGALLGSGVVLQRRFDPVGFGESISEHGVTLASLVPRMLAKLLDADIAAPPGLRAVFIGGARAEPRLLCRARDAGWPVVPTWGMTEAASQLATPSPAEAAQMRFDDGPAPALPPLPGVSVRTDGSGRLKVRGPMLFAGYLGNAGPGPDAEGWFTTGDRGVVETDARVRILGRADGVIISGGVNVELDAVSRRLQTCPMLGDAIAIGLDDPDWGQRIGAVVVGRSERPVAVAALADWARSHLEPAERPAHWRVVDRIPVSATGKPLTPALHRLFE